MNTLSIRLTHGYVGTWSHLDKWQDIGSFEVLRTVNITDIDNTGDYCEPQLMEHMVLVTREDKAITDEQVIEALHSHFTSHGCSHEYDCCGCRSYSTESVEQVTGDLWRVTVGSSRNY